MHARFPSCSPICTRVPRSLQREALQALATLTDAEHSEAVLQAVMAVRSTNDADLKALANSTASAIIRRFGVRAVGRSASLEDISVSRPAAPVAPLRVDAEQQPPVDPGEHARA